MGIQINGATDSITAIDGTIDVVSAIGNAGVVTATAFVGNITGNVTGNINHASTLELQTGGVTRAHFNSSGHLGIAGITTMSGNLTISNAEPSLFFTDTNANPDYKLFIDQGVFKIYDTTYSATRLQVATNGEVTIQGNANFPNGITMNPGTASVVNTIAQRLGDTDTKIRFPAADTFTVETGGSERLRIASDGKIGIGTVATHSFEIFSGADHQNVMMVKGTNTDGNYAGVGVYQGNAVFTGGGIGSNSTGIVFRTAASGSETERLRITSSGTIGVNCTPTAAPLEVKQQSADGGALRLRDSSAQYRYLEFDVTGALTQITARSNNSHGKIDIGTLSQHGRQTRLYINSDGNVGINTNSVSIAGMSRYLSVSARNVTNGGAAVELVGARTGSDQSLGVINFVNQTSNVAEIRAKYQGSTTLGSLHFSTSGSEKLRIDSDGNITNTGIATSFVTTNFSANFAKLDIRGTNIANSNHYILSYGEGHANDHEFHMVNTLGDLVFRTGTGSDTDRLRIDSNSNLKQGTSNPGPFTSTSPTNGLRFLGNKVMQGSVSSTTTLNGSGAGTFDLGKLWTTDDTSIELFIQVVRNDSANYTTHYAKAFINKVRGSGMSQGHILYQNGAAAGFSITGISAGGYTGSGGSAHGTQITVTGGAGGVIYRATCFYTAISKNAHY